MGRKGAGVEVRSASIRLSFTLDGQQQKHTLYVGGKPLSPTPANVKYAHRVSAEIRQKIEAGVFNLADYFPHAAPASSTSTVGGALSLFLRTMVGEASTKAGYSTAVRFWKSHLGEHRMVAGLRHSDVLEVLAKRPDLSGKTVNNYVSVLRRALDLLVRDRVLPENPVGELVAPYQAPEPDPLTPDETEALLAYMRDNYPQAVWNYAEFKFFSGLRTSESFAVRAADVNLDKRQLSVHSSVVRGIEKSRTKTSTARIVRLNSRALAAIERQLALPAPAGCDKLFFDPRRESEWLLEHFFTRPYWIPAFEKLSIRYRQPYNTRHTYATLMLMAGMNPAFCARQMGHDIKVFFSTYSKWIDGAADDAEMRKLESAISPVSSPEL